MRWKDKPDQSLAYMWQVYLFCLKIAHLGFRTGDRIVSLGMSRNSSKRSCVTSRVCQLERHWYGFWKGYYISKIGRRFCNGGSRR
jgi:hypothetical protein